MALLTGAQIVCECLLENSVDTVFGYPGGNVITLYDALYDYSDRVEHVLTAHEQGAAHAADGYARASSKTGVCIATSGPGATNLVTGIATAFMDSIPMVAITGNVTRPQLGRDTFQEIDIFGVTMPITKHNFIVKDISELADVVRRAFKIANTGRKGPVLIDVLKDVFAAKTEFVPEKPVKEETLFVGADFESQIQTAAELIKASEKPIIFAGGGVISAEASSELFDLVKRMSCPIALSLMGIGAFPATEPEYTGMLGMHGSRTSSQAVLESDLIVAIGARFSDRVICNPKTFAKDTKIIHIDIDRSEINKNVLSYAPVEADVKVALKKLCELVPFKSREGWLEQIALWKKKNNKAEYENNLCSPQYVIECVSKLLNEDDYVVTDVGQHQMWTAQNYPVTRPRHFLSSGGLGTMGFGLGAAIGCAYSDPDKKVVLFTGDGSFGMNLNELCTAVKSGHNIVVILLNNGVLGMVRQWQKALFHKRYSATTLERKTDFVKLAEAFGAKAFKIDNHDSVMPVLCSAFKEDGTVFVEVTVDMDVNVLPMVPPGRSYDDPITQIDN